MASKYAEEEELVLCALEEAQSKPSDKVNITEIAKKHGVDAQRLRRRYLGKASRTTRAPANRKLNEDQERAIIVWVGILDAMCVSARPGLIEASANQLLREAHTDPHTSPPTVGKNWVRNFVARVPLLQRVKQRSQELLRMTHEPKSIWTWFDRLKAVIDKHGILADDTWNMDEIGFRIGIGGAQWIITLCPSREAHISSSTDRQSVTCVETVSASGAHIVPMVILAAAQHSESWAQNNLPGDTLLAVSSTGYSDDILALQWIRHFAAKAERMTRGSKRLLIFDGHGSHCTKQFLEVCEANSIIPFYLPPHSSHFLQPLDVAVFSPYKHWHKEAVDKATWTGCDNFSKTEFLAALHSIRAKTFKPNTIKAGFRLTGIHPFCPQEVLKRFETAQEPIQVPSPPPSSPVEVAPPTTPRTVRSLRRLAGLIEDRAEEVSPTLHRAVQQFARGAMVQAQAGSLASKALLEQTAAQKEREKRKERQRKITQSGGVLYAEEAREICEEKLEKEQYDQARREWAQTKRDVKKRKTEGWGRVHAQLRRAVKKRAKQLEEADNNEENEAEEEWSEDEYGHLTWEDVFGDGERA